MLPFRRNRRTCPATQSRAGRERMVLPCNVVVRSLDDTSTLVAAFDPDAMMGLTDGDALHRVATDAKQRLTVVLLRSESDVIEAERHCE